MTASASSDVLPVRCLPASRGAEISSAEMDGPRSLIRDQSGKRLLVQKAPLVELLGGMGPV